MTEDDDDDRASRTGRKERKSDTQGLVRKALSNGAGLIITRLMIIFGFPAISVLAAYAFNLTMEKFETGIKDVAKEVHQLSKTVDDVTATTKDTNNAVTNLRIDVTRLQDQQMSLSQRLDEKKGRP